ncbi:sulfotransferase 1E1 [Spodoptera frugiperda]|uniref:SFRICE_012524 n=2 Tax=Spodoptera frugiperda TaxID=7108 RepID=A0A2H1V3G5_SPOFR|nr:sulfotransferase 1E1 [Spodoptera frugiperda]
MAPWLEFPHEMKNVTGEEDKILRKCLLGYTKPFVRCGEKEFVMPGMYRKHAETIYNFQVRPDDVWVITVPRSGTTWVQELVWLVANNMDFKTAKDKPLYKRFPMLEISTHIPEIAVELIKINFFNLGNFQGLSDAVKERSWKTLDKAPSPRFIKTHLPLSMLPPNLLSTAKVVYVARDPRDVAVSYYYLYKMTSKSLMRANFTHFWEAFRRDLLPWTPIVAHANEAYEKRHHPNLHFVFYENMKKDLHKEISNVCKFLNKDYTAAQIDRLAEHLSFDSLRKNKNVNNTTSKDSEIQFIRKGEAGGWRTHFDEKMQLQAEEFLLTRLAGLELSYPSFPINEITRL